jgi:hypothetical protein
MRVFPSFRQVRGNCEPPSFVQRIFELAQSTHADALPGASSASFLHETPFFLRAFPATLKIAATASDT